MRPLGSASLPKLLYLKQRAMLARYPVIREDLHLHDALSSKLSQKNSPPLRKGKLGLLSMAYLGIGVVVIGLCLAVAATKSKAHAVDENYESQMKAHTEGLHVLYWFMFFEISV